MKEMILKSGIYFAGILVMVLVIIPNSGLAHMNLLFPDGSVDLYSYQVIEIKWDVYLDHGPGTVKIEYSTDNGSNYNLIVSGIPYSGPADQFGEYSWIVPEVDSSQCRIKVTYTAGSDYYNGLFGENDPIFSINNITTEELILEEGVDSYTGARDNTIYEGIASSVNVEDNSNGAGEFIFSGNILDGYARRALISYDISAIPSGATILSAGLQLTVAQTQYGDTPESLYVMTADWGEGSTDASGAEGQGGAADAGDATWNSSFHGTTSWSSPGAEGDYVPTASATATVGNIGTQAEWLSSQMAADVQTWLDGTTPNYGWILIGDESTLQTAKKFYSSDHLTATAGQKPRLVIRYLPTTAVRESEWKNVYR